MKKTDFTEGLHCGIPIGLGYLSVSFSFGMLAAAKGIPTLSALLISMTNLTSAGQVAGIYIVAAGGALLELALCQLVINLRYALMSLTISQKLQNGIGRRQRLLISFGITDEIFAVMASRKQEISLHFYFGLVILPYIGWSSGTLLGGVFGNVLPENITAVLGIALYGMFLAIIVPPAKHQKNVLCAVLCAAALSCILAVLPFISSGMSIIFCAVVASVFCAVFFPISKESEEKKS